MLVLINLVLYTSTLRAFANVYSQLRFTFNDSVVKKHILLGYFSRMASPPESPIEDIVYELEPTRMPKVIPVALDDLCRETKFSKQEIRVMYRGFKTFVSFHVHCE
ncbi:uncharacterized protein LOC129943158 isoform X2 [Eupeodes corollae]|uniref:uncharacterized protein LOC129943158 isoform X2 n=1 Tax=Eupeodes corollae TaxID=290404 RepID=UPI002491C33F|nr:uncharacterized protein LOC129943158 isoform X2 [Eupeodes corollae]